MESAVLHEARLERHLAAILAADVAGYSRLMGADEEGTLTRLKGHRTKLWDPAIARFRGHIANTAGDSILAEFGSVLDAVNCAVAIQRSMLERNAEVLPDERIEFRIGINLGDVITDGGDIFGDGVNVAARLESIADRGGICISRQVLDQVEGKLNLNFRELGDRTSRTLRGQLRFTPSSSKARSHRARAFLLPRTSSRKFAIAKRPMAFGSRMRQSAADRRC